MSLNSLGQSDKEKCQVIIDLDTGLLPVQAIVYEPIRICCQFYYYYHFNFYHYFIDIMIFGYTNDDTAATNNNNIIIINSTSNSIIIINYHYIYSFILINHWHWYTCYQILHISFQDFPAWRKSWRTLLCRHSSTGHQFRLQLHGREANGMNRGRSRNGGS